MNKKIVKYGYNLTTKFDSTKISENVHVSCYFFELSSLKLEFYYFTAVLSSCLVR